MATVIKQTGEIGGVRRLAQSLPPIALAVDPRDAAIALLVVERDALAADLAAMRETHARAEARSTEALASAVAAARKDALAEGRQAGLAAAGTREADRIAAIAHGVAAEASRLDERLASIDGLAASLARVCLDRVFARPGAMAAMVVDALARHLATLRDEAVLTVRVSGADFGDTGAIEAAVRAAGARAAVAIDLDLPAGACRISARLGQIDLDVPEQWRALATLLDDMAAA